LRAESIRQVGQIPAWFQTEKGFICHKSQTDMGVFGKTATTRLILILLAY
jgi:hypothetical protein